MRIGDSENTFCTSFLIPGARRILAPQPLQYLQVSTLSCISACQFIPRTALAPEPLQYLQVTCPRCTRACACIPRASLAPEPLQYLQVTITCCNIASLSIPRASLAPEPLQCLHMADSARLLKDVSIQTEPLFCFQPLQGLQLASLRCEEERARKRSEAKTSRRGDCKKEDLPAFKVIFQSSVFKPARSSCSRGRWP